MAGYMYNTDGRKVLVEREQMQILLDAGWTKKETAKKESAKKESAPVKEEKTSSDKEETKVAETHKKVKIKKNK